MCIRYIKKYTGCPHTGVIYDRCDIYLNNPDTKHDIIKQPETISGVCRKCGGGPQPEPVITFLDLDSISSWAQESANIEEKEIASTFSTDSSVELLRKGSQRAVGGVKRLIGSMRSKRSSGGSSGIPETGTSEMEWRADPVGKNTYSRIREAVDERKMVDTLGKGCQVKSSQKFIGGSLEPIHLNPGMNGKVHRVRHPLGRDAETASVVTTWTEVIGLVSGASESGKGREQDDVGACEKKIEVEQTSRVPDLGGVEVESVDKVLYQEKVQIRQAGVVMDRMRLEELARADERLLRVRDFRGYIDYDVI
jgi:hypothetical protein